MLYPLAGAMKETRSLETHSEKEHTDIRKLLVKLGASSPERKNWQEWVTRLETTVKHHVREEEKELFPLLKKLFTPKHLAELGAKVRLAKKDNLRKEVRPRGRTTPTMRLRAVG